MHNPHRWREGRSGGTAAFAFAGVFAFAAVVPAAAAALAFTGVLALARVLGGDGSFGRGSDLLQGGAGLSVASLAVEVQAGGAGDEAAHCCGGEEACGTVAHGAFTLPHTGAIANSDAPDHAYDSF